MCSPPPAVENLLIRRHNLPGGTMRRSTVNKRASARSFSKKAKRTHPKNMHVMRGGYRL